MKRVAESVQNAERSKLLKLGTSSKLFLSQSFLHCGREAWVASCMPFSISLAIHDGEQMGVEVWHRRTYRMGNSTSPETLKHAACRLRQPGVDCLLSTCLGPERGQMVVRFPCKHRRSPLVSLQLLRDVLLQADPHYARARSTKTLLWRGNIIVIDYWVPFDHVGVTPSVIYASDFSFSSIP